MRQKGSVILKESSQSRAQVRYLQIVRCHAKIPLNDRFTHILTLIKHVLLIAGIALSDNLVLITHNREHFSRIEGLEIADWSIE